MTSESPSYDLQEMIMNLSEGGNTNLLVSSVDDHLVTPEVSTDRGMDLSTSTWERSLNNHHSKAYLGK